MDNKSETGVEIPSNMQIHSKTLKKGVFEVNGVVIYAESHVEAIRKYLRQPKTVLDKHKPKEFR